VAFRRNRRLEYLGLRLPERWIGQPEPLIADTNGVADSDTLAGVGASAGVAEGRARVIRHAEEAHTLCHGEVLVCEITDPSWAPAFHVAAALIIDIGAVMSHGAILAREMGVPCVINTRVGTQVVHTGDTVRVDGDAGNVTILARNGID
jgi:pyruvate,water dikinase